MGHFLFLCLISIVWALKYVPYDRYYRSDHSDRFAHLFFSNYTLIVLMNTTEQNLVLNFEHSTDRYIMRNEIKLVGSHRNVHHLFKAVFFFKLL